MRATASKSARGGASSRPATRASAPPTVDEKDEYIVNLKGQLYLMSIENEIMKRGMSAPGGGALHATQHSDAAGGSMRSPALGTSALIASELPAASYPTEIGDAFEVMRQKYTQVRPLCAAARARAAAPNHSAPSLPPAGAQVPARP
jgi:hypothetical protein